MRRRYHDGPPLGSTSTCPRGRGGCTTAITSVSTLNQAGASVSDGVVIRGSRCGRSSHGKHCAVDVYPKTCLIQDGQASLSLTSSGSRDYSRWAESMRRMTRGAMRCDATVDVTNDGRVMRVFRGSDCPRSPVSLSSVGRESNVSQRLATRHDTTSARRASV